MSPWWLRPTAEGATNDEESAEKQAEPTPQAAAPLPQEPPAETAPLPRPSYQAPLYEPAEPRDRDRDAVPAAAYAAPGPRAVPYEPEPAEAPEPLETEAEAEAESEPEANGEAAEREDGAGEKRRRSRSRRGGRRRSRSTEPRADEDEPEDDLAEEDEPRAAAAFTPMPPLSVAPMPSLPAVERRRETIRAGESFSFPDTEPAPREIVVTIPDRPRSADERKIAMFCDLENIALGVRDSDVSKFDINLILERLLEKGKIIVKKAYADWERYSEYKRPFHEAAIELIDIPQKYYSGKNSADIKMVVDAMDLSYSKEHLDTFVLLSGDSDFSPLVSKLKENNKYVIGIGVKNSSSNLLVDNCDEFIYYEDVWRDTGRGPQLTGLTKKQSEVFGLMVESIQALVRENKDVLWGSMIKQTMQRKKPSFNEGYYGYSTFSELLEDAERKNIVKLKKDQRSGTYIVTGFAKR